MRSAAPGHRPIGFWLKLVDRLLDDSLDAMLATRALTRRHWQVLNVVASGAIAIDDIDVRVRPFLVGAEVTTEPVVSSLLEAGWLREVDGRFELATSARLPLAELSRDVSLFRRSTIEGIETDAYDTTVATLERMAVNLGWTDETDTTERTDPA